jgi:hypothetical protein
MKGRERKPAAEPGERKPPPDAARCGAEEAVLELQRKTGNRAMNGLLEGNVPSPLGSELSSHSGQPLNPDLRRTFELTLGRDLTSVRVHTDRDAARMAEAEGARAFTVGSDVYFGLGEYAPATGPGRHLIAHELTHVLQQAHSLGALASPQPLLEAEAEAVARGSQNVVAHAAPTGVVQRAEKVKPKPMTPEEREATQKWLVEEQEKLGAEGKKGFDPGEAEAALREPLTKQDLHKQAVEAVRGYTSRPSSQADRLRQQPATLPPEGAKPARVTGAGYETYAAIQILDKNGKRVAVEPGAYRGGGGELAHAERVSLAALGEPTVDVKGGTLMVVVETEPCRTCLPALEAYAAKHGLKLQVSVPERPGVTAKTASTTSLAKGATLRDVNIDQLREKYAKEPAPMPKTKAGKAGGGAAKQPKGAAAKEAPPTSGAIASAEANKPAAAVETAKPPAQAEPLKVTSTTPSPPPAPSAATTTAGEVKKPPAAGAPTAPVTEEKTSPKPAAAAGVVEEKGPAKPAPVGTAFEQSEAKTAAPTPQPGPKGGGPTSFVPAPEKGPRISAPAAPAEGMRSATAEPPTARQRVAMLNLARHQVEISRPSMGWTVAGAAGRAASTGLELLNIMGILNSFVDDLVLQKSGGVRSGGEAGEYVQGLRNAIEETHPPASALKRAAVADRAEGFQAAVSYFDRSGEAIQALMGTAEASAAQERSEQLFRMERHLNAMYGYIAAVERHENDLGARMERLAPVYWEINRHAGWARQAADELAPLVDSRAVAAVPGMREMVYDFWKRFDDASYDLNGVENLVRNKISEYDRQRERAAERLREARGSYTYWTGIYEGLTHQKFEPVQIQFERWVGRYYFGWE